MKPEDCSRWNFCNAPFCPLGAGAPGSHLSGERVCLWLRELCKPTGERVLASALPPDQLEAVRVALATIMQHRIGSSDGLGAIQRVLKRSALGRSKILAGRERFPQSSG